MKIHKLSIGNSCNFCNVKSDIMNEIQGDSLKVYMCPSCIQKVSDYHNAPQKGTSMSASEVVKSAGLPSLEWLSGKVGKPSQTLRNWHREYPALFDAVVNGVQNKDIRER